MKTKENNININSVNEVNTTPTKLYEETKFINTLFVLLKNKYDDQKFILVDNMVYLFLPKKIGFASFKINKDITGITCTIFMYRHEKSFDVYHIHQLVDIIDGLLDFANGCE